MLGQPVNSQVDALHGIQQFWKRLIAVVHDSFVRIPVGRIHFRVVGVIVRVAVPMPADAHPAFDEPEGEVLVECAAVLLNRDEPTGSTGLAMPLFSALA